MKTILIILLIATGINGNAQTEPAEPGAKSAYQSFWKIAGEIDKGIEQNPAAPLSNNKVLSMKSKLSTVKMKDKNFDVSPMEQKLKAYEDFMNDIKNKSRSAYNAGVKEQLVLDNIIKNGAPKPKHTGQREKDINLFKEELLQFKKSVDDYLATNPDASKFNTRLNTVKASAANALDIKDRYSNLFMSAQDESGLYAYYDLMGLQTYWQQLKRFFPASSEVMNAEKQVTEGVIKAGSEAQLLARFKTNKAEALKNAKMPAAVVKDEATEKIFKSFFLSAITLKRFTPVEVHIMSSDWMIDRNKLTSIIIQRSKHAVVSAKQADGTCWLLNVWISQDYTGNGYGNSKHGGDNILSETLCENIL